MFYLAPHIHITPVRDKIVVLDLLKDKYSALSSELSRALFHQTSPRPLGFPKPEAPPETLDRLTRALLQRGILQAEPPLSGKPPAWAAAVTPVTTRWPSATVSDASMTPSGFMAVMAALSQVAITLRTAPFREFIATIEREPVRRPTSRSEQRVLDDFYRARPWFPLEPICRLDAPALCLHLRRNGHPANLVFGVTLETFAAHCWVQVDDRVLREPHETVAGYSPILIV